MAVQNQDETFENFESNFFSFESVLSSDKTDPDKNFFNDKLQQIDSPYFSVENFIAISEQLNNKDNFSILHLNIRSLNANIDNFRIPKWKFQCYCSYGILVRLNCKRDLSIKPR